MTPSPIDGIPMATEYETLPGTAGRGRRYSPMQLPSGFSIIVDDVDGDREPLSPGGSDGDQDDVVVSLVLARYANMAAVGAIGAAASAGAASGGATGSADEPLEQARDALAMILMSPYPCEECGAVHAKQLLEEGMTDQEVSCSRLAKVRVQELLAQIRKDEFAVLLEEHAEVVLQVKQMEEREQRMPKRKRKHRRSDNREEGPRGSDDEYEQEKGDGEEKKDAEKPVKDGEEQQTAGRQRDEGGEGPAPQKQPEEGTGGRDEGASRPAGGI